MFRRPGASRSKATADTLCQKCLKKGHYSYECKAPAQERPYTSRPSRTQQLLNPKLQPKLTTQVPEDLLRKKGIADDILKKKEEERGRKSSRDRKRSRSASSADSVSTISTNRSPSRSPSPPRRRTHDTGSSRAGRHKAPIKRRRRSASRESHSSVDSDRITRRRRSSFSPGERGRKRTRSRSQSARMDSIRDNGQRPSRRDSHSQSRSRQRHGKQPGRRRHATRSRSRSLDQMDTSEDHGSRNKAFTKRAPSKSPSPYRGSRDRSPSPYSKRRAPRQTPSPPANGFASQKREIATFNKGNRNHHAAARRPPQNRFDSDSVGNGAPPVQAPPLSRERSLSPYSKRVALTRQMQS